MCYLCVAGKLTVMERSLFTLVLYLLLQPVITVAQCPLDIFESTMAPEDNMLIYMPLDRSFVNKGTGIYSMNLTQAVFDSSGSDFGLRFDGFDDYLELTPSVRPDGDFTIIAWLKPDKTDGPQGIFSVRDQCDAIAMGTAMAQFSINEHQVPGISYQVNTHENCTDNFTGDRYSCPSLELKAGKEVMVSVTVRNNSSELRDVKFYGDCLHYPSQMVVDAITDAVFNDPHQFATTIGSTSNKPGFYNSLNGLADELRVYSRVLTDREIREVYHHVRPLKLYVNFYDFCTGDSATIRLNNTESDVKYQLKDITTNQFVSEAQYGNCGWLIFSTGKIYDTTAFKIVATNTISGCTIELDSVIRLNPVNHAYYRDISTILCEGDSILFGGKYLFEGGQYADTIYLEKECDSVINLTVNLKRAPFAGLINDTILCHGRQITLIAENPDAQYTWNDNSHLSFLTATETGSYWVHAYNMCGELKDTVNIEFKDCNCDFRIPNAFTPNGDDLNDYFNIRADCLIHEFKLVIINAWGQPVFESNSIDHSWSGDFNGSPCSTGLYNWQLYYRSDEFEVSGTLRGYVTLVR